MTQASSGEGMAQRNSVYKIAGSRPADALKIARSIKHPWYRCQALAQVAAVWGDKQQKTTLLNEAMEAAASQDEINRVVTASSWPLREMVRYVPGEAKRHLGRLVAVANREAHTLRRADALYAVAATASDVPSLLDLAMPSLIKALLQSHGWRTERLIRAIAPMVKRAYPDDLPALLAHHRDDRKKRQLLVQLGQDAVL